MHFKISKLLQLVLLPITTCFTAKNVKMHKYEAVPTCFNAKKYLKLLPKPDSSAHSPKLKTGMTCDNSHTHNALQCNTRCHFFGGSIPQLLILNSETKLKNFPMSNWGSTFNNFSP